MPRSSGVYARCSQPRCSFSSASRRVVSVSTMFFGCFRNQYDSTGTIVSETSSDESIAIVTVSANGANSSPTRPPTSAIGRNTATVVRVEEVIAPATSRTPARIACCFASP